MSCLEYRELLIGFHDRELSPSEEQLLKNHLAECTECINELEEIRQFSARMHHATAPFRQATSRVESSIMNRIQEPTKSDFRVSSFWRFASIGLSAAALFIVGFFLLKAPSSSDELLASWGVQHYALVYQAHAVTGNAESVQHWFLEHHQMKVRPPQQVDYSHLTGCKMSEFDSQPVPLLRFGGKQTRAVFILPEGRLSNAPQVLSRNGFRIEFWKEGNADYMVLTQL